MRDLGGHYGLCGVALHNFSMGLPELGIGSVPPAMWEGAFKGEGRGENGAKTPAQVCRSC